MSCSQRAWIAACDEAIQEMIASFQQRFAVSGKQQVATHWPRVVL
jgi:hypothetical protein